ncbi:hypothetical protein [Streptomyces sp. NPDC001530]|uniref:hypothetical protein n=1 Tax=Streptomyces sp. NPDC001530 TaxID=3364582 RepID=UPI0036A5792A
MQKRTVVAGSLLTVALIGAAMTPAHADDPVPPYTERISVDGSGGQAGAASFGPASAERAVAFTSNAPLLSGDDNGASDVYLRTNTGTHLVSYAATVGGHSGDGRSYDPSVCAGGRFVAFVSEAANLTTTPRTDHEPRIYLRNRSVGKIGAIQATYQGVALTAMGQPTISADCQWVAFVATPVTTDGSVSQPRVYRYRVYDGSLAPVSRPSEDGSRAAGRPSISADGRYIAYQYTIPHPGGPANYSDVYVRDMETGGLEKASVARDGGDADRESTGPALSADGRTVAFDSYASNLAPGDTNGSANVFVRNLDTGRTKLVKGQGRKYYTYGASLSADGLRVAYESGRLGDVSDLAGVWLADLGSRTAQLISVDTAGGPGDLPAGNASLSPDGTAVAFDSYADDLVADDTNGTADVFVRHLS